MFPSQKCERTSEAKRGKISHLIRISSFKNWTVKHSRAITKLTVSVSNLHGSKHKTVPKVGICPGSGVFKRAVNVPFLRGFAKESTDLLVHFLQRFRFVLCFYAIIAIKHVFYALTFAQLLGKSWNIRLSGSGFQHISGPSNVKSCLISYSCLNCYAHSCLKTVSFSCCLNMVFTWKSSRRAEVCLHDVPWRNVVARNEHLSMFLLMSTLLAEVTSLTFDFAIRYNFVQRNSTYKILLRCCSNQIKCKNNDHKCLFHCKISIFAGSLGRRLNTWHSGLLSKRSQVTWLFPPK